MKTRDERFDEKWILTPSGCHQWIGSSQRYGRFRITGGMIMAHRYAYQRKYGSIPDGLVLDHFVCDNTLCVNPDHVRPVTHRENVLRSTGLASLNAAKTHCPKGHEYNESNTGWRPTGGRRCRACNRENRR